nr:MAG TPA: hypothetical protein [Caudoviricetes sp.]DAP61676.1 MAG TPA: hypothetical protein [Bacteriophage sp.]
MTNKRLKRPLLWELIFLRPLGRPLLSQSELGY